MVPVCLCARGIQDILNLIKGVKCMAISLKKVTAKSKKTGKDFQAYELKAGLYSTLIFPSPLEMDYLDNYLVETAHEDFKNDGENLFD